MSFILDALKKADAERKLGQLPGIHTHQTVEAARPAAHGGWRGRQWFLALASGVAVVAVAIGGWQLQSRRNETPLVPAAPGNAGATSVTAVAQHDVAPPHVPSQAPATDVPVPAAPVPKVRIALRKAPVVSVLPADKTALAGETRPIPAPANVATLGELPPAIQREIPPLAISGSMYSTNPADRMLLVDKRMLHEGDEVAPGLVLDRVLPKGAILRYKGHLFRVTN